MSKFRPEGLQTAAIDERKILKYAILIFIWLARKHVYSEKHRQFVYIAYTYKQLIRKIGKENNQVACSLNEPFSDHYIEFEVHFELGSSSLRLITCLMYL